MLTNPPTFDLVSPTYCVLNVKAVIAAFNKWAFSVIVKLQTSRRFVSFPALLTISLYSDHIIDQPLPYCRHLARVSTGEVSHHPLTTHRCHHHSLDTQCHYLGTH